jgi:hypothetical protein
MMPLRQKSDLLNIYLHYFLIIDCVELFETLELLFSAFNQNFCMEIIVEQKLLCSSICTHTLASHVCAFAINVYGYEIPALACSRLRIYSLALERGMYYALSVFR